ncbi:unnamed protein product [Linum tenue]|uniref:Chromo domain-containing protein n=1 Tax=Linum tenue TaxID=586396 RepID=A0AAV0LGP1_9ROSI|nr:unnamed protein product [Linum tenue]
MKSKRKASVHANLLSANGAAAADDQGQAGGGLAGPARDDGAVEILANRDGDEGKLEKPEEVVVEDGEREAEAEMENDGDGEEAAAGEEEAAEEDEQDEGQDERPKLDDGFFEIEAIRRKRVRKGQLQYLIKWRGWPETANTWEPLENLQACSDFIEAFEERMQSEKSIRKRKRKSGGSNSQGKKKQSRASSANNLTGDDVSAADRSLPSTSLNTSGLASLRAHTREEESDENGTNVQVATQAGESWCTSRPRLQLGVKDDTEYDPKLSELRGTATSNDVNGDQISVQFVDSKALEVVENGSSLKVDSVDPVQTNRRTGAKRRKSESVKRFKKDPASFEAPLVDNSACNISLSFEGEMTEASKIIKILKPVSYSASSFDNIQDVVVTFAAVRSDGKQVLVNNKFLKANDPLLLINYYEKHLKYST